MYSQRIEESKFDAKDSVHTYKTSTEIIGSRILPASGDIKTLRACAVYSKSVAVGNRSLSNNAFEPLVSFFFLADQVTFLTGGVSSVKVKFTDGEIVEHKHEGSNKLISTNQPGAIYFTVFTSDKIFTTPIKSIKISINTGDLEFDIEEKRRDIIRNSLQLLYNQSKLIQ